jgi:transposase
VTPEKLFHELLGLGLNWEVSESRFDRVRSLVVLEIRETERLWESERCPQEGGRVYCYDHTEELVWRHLNVFEHQCEIHCRLPRGKCRQCGHVYRVRPPWEGLSKHFSKEFEAYALLLMREMPMARVAELTGESDTRLWRMLFQHVDCAYAEADFSNVCCVGVDEMNLRKGHKYISVFADLVAKRVIYAVEGNDQQTWGSFVEAFEKHNGHRHSITQVSMDMSVQYKAGVREYCRNAQMVFDKFHVIAHANQGVDKVRKAEVRLGGKGIWESLNKSQWLWRKNPENLTEKETQRLDQIKDKKLCTAKAYQMRLLLQDIYQSPTTQKAKQGFLIWCRWVRWVARFHNPRLFAPMVKVANMIQNHLAGILAHWKWHLTNAFMEGLNSVFSAVKRRARGYRSPEYLITILYLLKAKLRLPHGGLH